MWEIDFAQQIKSFFYSIVLGGMFGLLYDVFRIPFKRKGVSAVVVFVADVFYFAFIGIVYFCFLLGVSNGEVRGYLFLGAALGFLAYKKSLSPIILLVIRLILRPMKWVFLRISRTISAFSDLVWNSFLKTSEKIADLFKKILKKG